MTIKLRLMTQPEGWVFSLSVAATTRHTCVWCVHM